MLRSRKRFNSLAHVLCSFVFVAALAILHSGCSSEVADTYPVSGKVLLGGQPLAGASIMLQPVDGGIYGYGVSEEDGSFIISTSAIGDGAIPGEHRIIVTKQGPAIFPGGEPEILDEAKEHSEVQQEVNVVASANEPLIPERYSDVETSGLSVMVKAGLEPIVLELGRN